VPDKELEIDHAAQLLMPIRQFLVVQNLEHALGQPFCHNMLRLDTFEVSEVVSINAYTISIANHHT
jgi:hypothetical protein